MNAKKLILLGILFAPGAAFAASATLSVLAPSQVTAGVIATSTITLNTGSVIQGAADFTVTFDTHVIQVNGVGAAAPQFQNGFYSNTSTLSQGLLHVLAVNGASATAPTGTVTLATMTFTATTASSSTTLGAQVTLVVDTQPVAYSPISVVTASFTIVASSGSDILPPRTQVVISTPAFGQNPISISSHSLLNFFAVDDRFIVGDSVGVGVQNTKVSVDSGSFTNFSTPFSISTEGVHTLKWFSSDLSGNTEVTHSTSVAVDKTPPVSQSTFTGTLFVDTSAVVYMTPTSQIALSAQDPVSSGTASGVALTQYSVDSGTFLVYTSSFTLSEGAHTVRYQSQDNVGNLEISKILNVRVDATAPQTVVSATSSVVSNGTLIISSVTKVGFSRVDVVINGVASGVKQTQYAVDGSSFSLFSTTFTVSGEGSHSLQYFSQDNVGNTELTQTTSVIEDNTPPELQVFFAPDGVVSSAASPVLIDTRTQISLASEDTVAGSSVTKYRVDNSSTGFKIFASTFSLSVGTHSLIVQALDRVGNTITSPSFNVTVGTSAPAGSGVSEVQLSSGITLVGSQSSGTVIIIGSGGTGGGGGGGGSGPTVSSIALTPAPPVGLGTVIFAITFSKTMNTAVAPNVTFTLPNSTTTVTVTQSSYSGAIWTGSAVITAGMPSGTATLAISGAADTLGGVIPNSLSPFDINLTAPSAPTSAAVTYSGAAGNLQITWQNGSGALPASYNLYRATSSINSLSGLVPIQTGLVVKTATDMPPAASPTIFYAVTAIDAAGNPSGPSNSPSFALPLLPVITAPANSSSLTSSSPTLVVNVTGIAEPGVVVKITTGTPPGGVLASTATGVSSSFSLPITLSSGTFLINAVAQSQTTSAFSSTATVSVTIHALPNAPTGLSAHAGDTVVDLSWTQSAAPGISGYRIYRDGQTPSLNFNVIPVNQISFEDQALTNGRTYSYTITTVDSGSNESLPSAAVTAAPVAGVGW